MKSKLLIAAALAAALGACQEDAGGADDARDAGGHLDNVGDAGSDADPTGENPAALCADPGRVTLRRLTRLHYDNTVRDLLGTDLQPARSFPEDDIGYGFDNIGDVLSVSPLHVESYEAAARLLVESVLKRGVEPQSRVFEAEVVGSDVGAAHRGEAWNLWSNGEIVVDLDLPDVGEYVLRVRAGAQQAGPEPARMTVGFDRQEVATFDVRADQNAMEIYEHRLRSEGGAHSVSVAFINDYYMPDDPDRNNRDRNLIVDWIEVDGPYGAPAPDSAQRARVMVCEPAGGADAECARQVVTAFARRAWRRPLADDEVDRLMGLVQLAVDEGDHVEVGIQIAVQAVLLSPHFLYRVELDADPESTTPHPLTDHELATRLSYFIWGSTPDEGLLAAADTGRLSDPEVLAEQVDRLLADPRSLNLVDDFADQWLFIRAMHDVAPDYNYFPSFDDELRASMITEARLFFRAFLEGNRPVTDALDADFTFIDARLAEHYGIALEGAEPAAEPGFFRVSLDGTERGGLLTLGSVLTVTSFPTRTSPVKRGKWVLEQILCAPPPAPPPGVENLPAEVDGSASLRRRLEQHRADPACNTCHKLMDPIGLGMENFDAIGTFRTEDADLPVDASGVMPDGTEFEGVLALQQIIKDDPRLTKCFTQKMMTYALGRGVEREDACAVNGIAAALPGAPLQDVVHALTQSPQFTMRRGEGGEQ